MTLHSIFSVVILFRNLYLGGMSKCGYLNRHQKDICVKERGICGSEYVLGSLRTIFGGSTRFFEKPYQQKELMKSYKLLLKSYITFTDPRKIMTLKSKLRIIANNKTNHSRHIYLSE